MAFNPALGAGYALPAQWQASVLLVKFSERAPQPRPVAQFHCEKAEALPDEFDARQQGLEDRSELLLQANGSWAGGGNEVRQGLCSDSALFRLRQPLGRQSQLLPQSLVAPCVV